jgi:hypothetical protein
MMATISSRNTYELNNCFVQYLEVKYVEDNCLEYVWH